MINFFMSMLCVILIYRIVTASFYVEFLRQGLSLSVMIAAAHNLALESVTTHTNKAVQQITNWTKWRYAAFVSLFGTVVLWTMFSSGMVIDPISLVCYSGITGYVLSKIFTTSLMPGWSITWRADMVRIHDIHTLQRILDRMPVLAEIYVKDIENTSKMSPDERIVVDNELKSLTTQLAIIQSRNKDLIKAKTSTTSKG